MQKFLLACVLAAGVEGCANGGNSGSTSDSSVTGVPDSVNVNGGGSGMSGPATGTAAGSDTMMRQRMGADSLRKDSFQ